MAMTRPDPNPESEVNSKLILQRHQNTLPLDWKPIGSHLRLRRTRRVSPFLKRREKILLVSFWFLTHTEQVASLVSYKFSFHGCKDFDSVRLFQWFFWDELCQLINVSWETHVNFWLWIYPPCSNDRWLFSVSSTESVHLYFSFKADLIWSLNESIPSRIISSSYNPIH